MAESELRTKRRKLQEGKELCIICEKTAALSEFSSPNDHHSWTKLCDAAALRDFEPILLLAKRSSGEDDNREIYYHQRCRSDFTHKKALASFKCNVLVLQKQWQTPHSGDHHETNLKLSQDECMKINAYFVCKFQSTSKELAHDRLLVQLLSFVQTEECERLQQHAGMKDCWL